VELRNILNNRGVKAGSWYAFTEFFTKDVTFLTIPIFTRLLSPADYGVTSLYASKSLNKIQISMLSIPSMYIKLSKQEIHTILIAYKTVSGHLFELCLIKNL